MTNVLEDQIDGNAAAGSTAEEQARDMRLAALVILAGVAAREMVPDWKDKLREVITRDPIDSLAATVLGGGLLFHLAEHESNPRCATYWDSVLYVATSLSVGFDDVFPRTSAGNAIAAAVQTFGPAMSAASLSPPAATTAALKAEAAASSEELLAVNKAILCRLEEIAKALKAREEPSGSSKPEPA